MIVTLSGEAERYVTEVMGHLPSGGVDEVVNWLILKQRADDASDRENPPPTEAELVEELLRGVRSPHRPYEPGEFSRQAERLITEREST